MVKRESRQPERGERDERGPEQRGDTWRGRAIRKAIRTWRQVVDGAASIVDGITGALGPAPRPVVVPVPVRSTRRLRPST